MDRKWIAEGWPRRLSSTKGNNVENNPKQRNQQKQIGGITGRGFTPGKSGNPNGRPHSRGLITALRLKVAEIAADGRTLEEHLIDVLLQEALRGKHRLPAVELIFDRLEGRACQQIEVADITRELREKSDQELRFHLRNDRRPTPEELQTFRDSDALPENPREGRD